MIRGIVKNVLKGVIQRVSASVWGDGSIDDRELFQHYGYSSRPLPGAEVIFIRQGNHIIAIASDDRRYRLELEEGECALYDDLGQRVHLTRSGIVATSPKSITASAPHINLGGDRAGLLALIDERILALFNAHTHAGVKSGSDTSSPPVVPITAAMVCTVITKAK